MAPHVGWSEDAAECRTEKRTRLNTVGNRHLSKLHVGTDASFSCSWKVGVLMVLNDVCVVGSACGVIVVDRR